MTYTGECTWREITSPSGIHRIIITWTADASGDVRYLHEVPINGRIMKVQAAPDSVGSAYSITLVDEQGVDALAGTCGALSASDGEAKWPTLGISTDIGFNSRLCGLYTFIVDAAASESGRFTLWVWPDGETTMSEPDLSCAGG
jgi:hypothetical protein